MKKNGNPAAPKPAEAEPARDSRDDLMARIETIKACRAKLPSGQLIPDSPLEREWNEVNNRLRAMDEIEAAKRPAGSAAKSPNG